MARRFEGSKPGESLTFQPEALPTLRVDPNPSRFGPIIIQEWLLASLAKGQIQECLVRMDSEYNPILYVGRNRLAHVLFINAHPERWEEWGIKAPLCLRAKYMPITAEAATEMGIDENLDRNELRVVDKAMLAQRYQLGGRDKAWIAQRLRLKSTARVSQLLDLFSLGEEVLELVAQAKLTEAAARQFCGLPEARIAEIAALVRGGQGIHSILSEIREQHRLKGKPRPRSGKEVGKAFEDLGGDAGASLAAWWRGESVGDLATILKELGVKL
jgi:hypothetical protein